MVDPACDSTPTKKTPTRSAGVKFALRTRGREDFQTARRHRRPSARFGTNINRFISLFIPYTERRPIYESLEAAMPSGAYTLAQFPLEMVELACEKCGRRGRLSKARLIEEHGPDIALPDLRTILARCERAGSMSDPCGAYYVALDPG